MVNSQFVPGTVAGATGTEVEKGRGLAHKEFLVWRVWLGVGGDTWRGMLQYAVLSMDVAGLLAPIALMLHGDPRRDIPLLLNMNVSSVFIQDTLFSQICTQKLTSLTCFSYWGISTFITALFCDFVILNHGVAQMYKDTEFSQRAGLDLGGH